MELGIEIKSFFKKKKKTAGHLCIRPTTQQLYQGAGEAGKPKPEESLAKSGAQGRGFEPPRGLHLFTSISR